MFPVMPRSSRSVFPTSVSPFSSGSTVWPRVPNGTGMPASKPHRRIDAPGCAVHLLAMLRLAALGPCLAAIILFAGASARPISSQAASNCARNAA